MENNEKEKINAEEALQKDITSAPPQNESPPPEENEVNKEAREKGKNKKNGKDLFTEGSLWKNMFLFSMPLVFSQLLQVLFNMSDVAVVGKFGSADAMGSVGSTSTLVALFTGFLIGLGAGVNVKVAQFVGAKKDKDVRETVQTSFVLSLTAGIVVFLACFFLGSTMLGLLDTNAELLPGAVRYFRIYAFGMPALAVFNFGNGVLSATGDTKRPLVYLTVSGVLNIILNIFFVVVCKMQAEGVAYASIISQYLSAVLVMIRLIRRTDSCAFSFAKMSFAPDKAKAVLVLGLSAGIQNALFSIANLFVQKSLNSFDKAVVNGNVAAANADTIVYNVMAAFYTAGATFVGQNFGAGKKERILKSYFVSLVYALSFGLVLGLLLVVFSKQFLFLFTQSGEGVSPEEQELLMSAATERLKIMGCSYFISSFVDSAIAASRGLGKSLVPTIALIFGTCVFRIIWIYTVFAHFHTILSLYLLYPASWIITATFEIIYFFKVYKKIIRPRTQTAETA